jgi:hypothetical protein
VDILHPRLAGDCCKSFKIVCMLWLKWEHKQIMSVHLLIYFVNVTNTLLCMYCSSVLPRINSYL